MKKLLVLMFSVFMLLALVGCGGQEKKAEKAPAKVLRVATDANYPPFEYYQSRTAVHTGYDVDLMNALGKAMGYDKVEFSNVAFGSIDNVLASKKADVAIAGITINEERKAKMAFSDPYIKDGLKIIVDIKGNMGDDAKALAGKKVAVEKSSTAWEFVKKNGQAKEIIALDDNETVIKAVHAGVADCAVMSQLVGKYYITNGFGKDVKFAGEAKLDEEVYGIALAKDNKELQAKLNKALADYKKTPDHKKLVVTYFGK